LLQNLVGYVDEEEGMVRVVAGGHRLRALKELGWAEKVPVRLVPREKAALLSLAENLARKELSPLEEALAVARLLERYAKEEVAKELGRSPAWVEARAKVAKGLVPEAKEALGRWEIGFGLAALLAAHAYGAVGGLPGALLGAGVYFAANTGAMLLLTWFLKGLPPKEAWRRNYAPYGVTYLLTSPVALLAARLYEVPVLTGFGPLDVAVLLLP
ncbi:ParB N-terminal domain-containing protein, partial [Thermus sp.]|uniref:ParB/RepB/Spo0J family partition protein n=1 Tax=Thermus sp. TaxID=275 RepID=UPI00260C42B7